jgi:hypothetical protein
LVTHDFGQAAGASPLEHQLVRHWLVRVKNAVEDTEGCGPGDGQ